jgi:hypothetical protein
MVFALATRAGGTLTKVSGEVIDGGGHSFQPPPCSSRPATPLHQRGS